MCTLSIEQSGERLTPCAEVIQKHHIDTSINEQYIHMFIVDNERRVNSFVFGTEACFVLALGPGN